MQLRCKPLTFWLSLFCSGRDQGDITEWLHDLEADDYLENFKAHNLNSIEELNNLDISENDLKFIGVNDLMMRKKTKAGMTI